MSSSRQLSARLNARDLMLQHPPRHWRMMLARAGCDASTFVMLPLEPVSILPGETPVRTACSTPIPRVAADSKFPEHCQELVSSPCSADVFAIQCDSRAWQAYQDFILPGEHPGSEREPDSVAGIRCSDRSSRHGRSGWFFARPRLLSGDTGCGTAMLARSRWRARWLVCPPAVL
jgi:hypothetical protein